MVHLRIAALALLIALFATACEAPVDEPEMPPQPPESEIEVHADDPAADPELEQPGLALADHLALLNAVTVKGRIMRSSELGHEAYDGSLSGEPMAELGRRWLKQFEQVEQFSELGVLHPHYLADGPAGTPRLRDYADATYIYHMHHSGGRFEDHGLFDELTHRPSTFLTQTGQRLLDNHFHDGRFHGDPASSADMAFGLDAFHGLAYAWVRWHKPGGADDMGRLDHEVMISWMGHDYPELLDVARQAVASLDQAWLDEAGAYDFGNGPRWRLDELASLIRGHKGLYELLYVFGNESDRDTARRLFSRAAHMVSAALDEALVRPWGLPAEIHFANGRAQPASDKVDIEAQWRLVHHLSGGFALLREQDGTSRFVRRSKPELAEHVGQAIDTLLAGALEHHMGGQGTAATIDYNSSEILDSDAGIGAMAAFVMAAGNAYRAGSAFDRPGAWEEDAALAERSRALYDAIRTHMRLLEVIAGEQG